MNLICCRLADTWNVRVGNEHVGGQRSVAFWNCDIVFQVEMTLVVEVARRHVLCLAMTRALM